MALAHHEFYDVQQAKIAKDRNFDAHKEFHDQHKKFLPPLAIGSAVIAQDPQSGIWADEAVISSIRPDGLSYEILSNGRALIRSRKMLRPLPNFIRFTSALLPTPSTSPPSSSWDHPPPQNSLQLTRTANPTGTSSGILISPPLRPGSSLTGPHSVEASRQLSLSSFSSSHCGLPCATTDGQTKKPIVQSCMSSSSFRPGTIATTTTTGIRSQPSAPLPGNRACLTSSPQLFPSVNNVDTRATHDFLPGNSFNSSSRHSNTTPLHPSTIPLHPSMLCLPPNLRTGLESGRFREPRPEPGSPMQMNNNSNAATHVRVPRQLPFTPESQTNWPNLCLSLSSGDWPSLPRPSQQLWTGWKPLLRNEYARLGAIDS